MFGWRRLLRVARCRPMWGKLPCDNVRCEFKFEAQQQPHSKPQPCLLPSANGAFCKNRPGHAPQSFNGAVGNDDRGRKFYSCGDPEGETPECFCYSHWSARDQRANSEGNQR